MARLAKASRLLMLRWKRLSERFLVLSRWRLFPAVTGPNSKNSCSRIFPDAHEHLKNLLLLPACGTKFYKYRLGWGRVLSEDFTDEEKERIISSLKKAIELSGFKAREGLGGAD